LIYRINPGGQYVLQQDLSIAYGHPGVLERENDRFLPPPFSPNVNLLVFSVLTIMKEQVQARPHVNMVTLRETFAKGGRAARWPPTRPLSSNVAVFKG
jgi:hypothetical protein